MKEETMERSDQELIEGYLAGADRDFELLYNRYKNQLYGYLIKMMPDSRAEADDVFQKSWIKVMQKLPGYRPSDRFQAWLFRIAHNLAIDYFRSRKRRSDHLELGELGDALEPQGKEQPAGDMVRYEISQALDKALDKLPPEQREVFMLRQENIGFKEISKIQKCSINTTLARMQYAVKKLRELLIDII
jgi:RNA polymerase sigma-70 factor (ECF subfamily)